MDDIWMYIYIYYLSLYIDIHVYLMFTISIADTTFMALDQAHDRISVGGIVLL